MRLVTTSVDGFKRFGYPSEMRASRDVTAIVGPNEAGKTSYLQALEHLSSPDPFERRDYFGRSEPPERKTIVSATFRAEPSELETETLSQFFDSDDLVELQVTKTSDPERMFAYHLEPELFRDTSDRENLVRLLRGRRTRSEMASLTYVITGEEGAEPEPDQSQPLEQLLELAELLEQAGEDLNPTEKAAIAAAIAVLENETLVSTKHIGSVLKALQEQAEIEESVNPHRVAIDELKQLIPRFLLFNSTERQIEDHYFWEEHDDPPEALANLLHLAELEFSAYKTIATDPERVDELTSLERRANEALESALEAWSQSDTTIILRANPDSLHVFAMEPVVGRDTRLSERSAGLRTFISMTAFAARHGSGRQTILLIDEAEEHLHYDAQADLIAVFETQQAINHILYTTHSVGCLPDDLGTSVRVVKRNPDSETSTVENNFWATGSGMTPLMLAMGATAIAFTPARTALIGEGPTEAVILPSLLREALGTSRGIGIQVAPGLAGVPDELAEELEADAGTVLYLVDDDEGGRTHAEKISQAAHDAGRVFVLGDGEEPGMSTEDLVERQLLCAAVNSVLALTRPEANVVLIQEEIPDVGRGAFIDEWCRSNDLPKLSKPHIAHEAIWKYLDAPDEWTLVEPDRMVLLKALGQNLLEKVPTAAH